MSTSTITFDGFFTPDLTLRSSTRLQVEHLYLLRTLAQIGQKANDLLRRIPLIEQVLLADGSPKAKRKLRKHLGWLKYRLGEAGRQEQTILQRLSQLAWEVRQRDRVIFLEEERRLQRSIGVSSLAATLDPTVPEFQPTFSQKHMWQAPGSLSAHIPWPRHTTQPACRPTRLKPVLTTLDEQDDMPPTPHSDEVAGLRELQVVNQDDIGKVGPKTYSFHVSTEEIDQYPFIVHRSSSTSDLQAMCLASRRNSLPSPTDMEQLLQYGLLDGTIQDEFCETPDLVC